MSVEGEGLVRGVAKHSLCLVCIGFHTEKVGPSAAVFFIFHMLNFSVLFEFSRYRK